jgi:acetyltransferase-like isoleucine patch superfamily enzyme
MIGPSLTAAHRHRLLDAGVPAEILDGLVLREVSDQLPEQFAAQGNAFYLAEGLAMPPRIPGRLMTYPFSNALVVLASRLDSLSLLVGGDGATVFVGPDSELTAGEIYCGGGSSVILHGQVVATGEAQLDARNGGSIVAERDQLWAARVYIATDDMHSLVDLKTGVRFNPYGGRIRIGRHVWLGREAIITGHVEIGESAVVGMRSLVRGQKVPANTAVAGTPARIIREGITWLGDDIRPLSDQSRS